VPLWHKSINTILAQVNIVNCKLRSFAVTVFLYCFQGLQYPPNHPFVDAYICRSDQLAQSSCVGSISIWHRNVDSLLTSSYTYPQGHLDVQKMLISLLPSTHPNVDYLMQNGTQFPSWHPHIYPYICQRTWSAGLMLGVIAACLFMCGCTLRCGRKLFKLIAYKCQLNAKKDSFDQSLRYIKSNTSTIRSVVCSVIRSIVSTFRGFSFRFHEFFKFDFE
jgi:hypothetical protein